MLNFYPFARPLLFSLDPELAHDKVLGSLDLAAKTGTLRLFAGPECDDPVELLGLSFPNRVGLAAGLDKNAAHVDALSQLGFGFIEVGTVTPKAQPGNPKPRMFRLPEHNALINRLGFNNQGVEQFINNVKQSRWIKEEQGLIGLNIGKNASTPIEKAADDYLLALRAVYPYAAYITVNISSPNTKNLRQLQSGQELDGLLSQLKQEQTRLAQEYRRYVPMLVKIAPDLDDDQVDVIGQTLKRQKIDGVIATNTTLNRSAVQGHRFENEAGGLSGAPVLAASNAVISKLRALLPSRYPIVGVGGVMTAQDAVSKIKAGADLVQIYTGLIYAGPKLVSDSAHAIRSHLNPSAIKSSPTSHRA
jgi:dihydroorotate dehydrogenase